MNPQSKTCFVISPIGPEDSTIRASANDFLDLLVEPALEKYGFTVARADRIAQPSSITTDIVRLVQDSDLCIIDLSGNNPNVFYECGRRHETGKPFVQMVRKGMEGDMPFDVSGIRTLIYDVSTARAARESVEKLQEFIDNIVASGFEAKTSGESLSSVAQAVERVERKLNQLISDRRVAVAQAAARRRDDDSLLNIIKNPKEVFVNALRDGDAERAYAVLPRLKAINSYPEYFACVVWVASTGHQLAFELMDAEILEVLHKPGEIEDPSTLIRVGAEGFRRYFENTGKIDEGISYIQKMYNQVSPSSFFDDDCKAFLANKVGMLAWISGNLDTCIKYTKLAIALSPEASYYYNLALACEASGLEAELNDSLKSLSVQKDLDEDHVELLVKHGFSHS